MYGREGGHTDRKNTTIANSVHLWKPRENVKYNHFFDQRFYH